jgi:hypothetical protein
VRPTPSPDETLPGAAHLTVHEDIVISAAAESDFGQ